MLDHTKAKSRPYLHPLPTLLLLCYPTNRHPMTKPALLHQILARLKPAVSESQQRDLLGSLTPLHSIPGLWGISAGLGIANSEGPSLCILVYLDDVTALDEFGPHPLHIEYLHRRLGPQVTSFVSADIPLAATPPPHYEAVHSLCFNFRSDATQEMIHALFQEMRSLSGIPGVLGLEAEATVSWRQQFQAAGVVYLRSVADIPAYRQHPLYRELFERLWPTVIAATADAVAEIRMLISQGEADSSKKT